MAYEVADDSGRKAMLDAVLADADGDRDNSRFLGQDPLAWRSALVELLAENRSDFTRVNADIRGLHPADHQQRWRLEQERADLAVRQTRLEARVRLVKGMIRRVPLEDAVTGETPIARAKAHIQAAWNILKELTDE